MKVPNTTFMLWQSWDLFGNVEFMSSPWGRVWSILIEKEMEWIGVLGRTCSATGKGYSGKRGPDPGVVSSEKAQSSQTKINK